MTDPVTPYKSYYLIDTRAWVDQRTGAHDPERSGQLRDFVRCDVFDAYRPTMGTAARMRLWCAAHGYVVGDGAVIEHDDPCLTKPVTVVLAATTGVPRRALALVSVDGDPPEVYADVTTDEGYWLTSSTIQITCPGGHAWTWAGDRYLHAADGNGNGNGQSVTDLFGPSRDVISRCLACAAFDDGHTDHMCPCPGHVVYCPTCGERCQVALPEIPTVEENRC